MGEVGSLNVRIGVDNQQFNKAMNNMQSRMKSVGQSVGNVGKGMTKWVTGPIVGAAAGIAGLVTKTTEYGDELDKTSTKLGVSVEQLQDWNHWAEQNGMSSKALERGIGRLNQRIGRAVDGNEKYIDAFEYLNVAIQDSEGNIRDTNDVMKDTVNALMEIEDPAMRSARASEVFGTKLARDLMPALEDGSLSIEEAVAQMDEHGRVTTEQAAQSAEFQDALDNVKKSFMGIIREVGMDFLPLIQDELLPLIQDKIIPAIRGFAERVQDLIDWFMDLSPETQKMILSAIGLAAAIGPVLIVIGKLITLLAPVIGLVKTVGTTIAAVAAGPFALIIAAIVAAIAIGWALYTYWDEIVEFVTELWTTFSEFFIELWEGIKEWFLELIENIFNFYVETWQTLADWFFELLEKISEFFHDIWQGIIDWFTDLITGIVDFYVWQWEFLLSTFQKILGTLKDFFKRTWNSIKSVGEKIWGGFRDGVLAIWDGLVRGIRGYINSIIDAVNGMVKRINRISFDVPDWVPVIGGRSWGFNLPTVPKLHDGGVFRAPNPGGEGLALLEDREVVTPAGASMSGGSQTIVIELDGRQIARTTLPHMSKELTRVGVR